MSFPKLNDFITKGKGKSEYKRISLIHSIKNSLTRNTIIESCKNEKKYYQSQLRSVKKYNSLQQQVQSMQPPSSFKYEQKIPGTFSFSTEDMYKLLEHLFNKKQHDMHDRNFIRRLMLKNFPQQLICAGGRDFVSLLKFDKLRKGERKIFDENQIRNDQKLQNIKFGKSLQRNFYFILKGKVRIFTEQFTYKKSSGQYFGELEILGSERILEIEAKSDTMLLYLNQEIFKKHLAQYFTNVYSEIRKKISLFEPILNLSPLYNQYKFLQILNEKQYKTGDKIYQKGEQITEVIFLNHAELSSTEDKLLNQFKAVGFGEVFSMDRPRANETTYCMDNKTVYSIKTSDFMSFIDKEKVLTFLNQYYNLNTLSGSKLALNHDREGAIDQISLKLDDFMDKKRVKFTCQKRRVLTEPNSSISMSSPTNTKHLAPYPEYATSFVFIKENTSGCLNQLKSNRLRNLRSQRTYTRSYLMKKNNSFRKKRWLDQIDTMNESIICNPEKMARFEMPEKTYEVKEFVVDGQ